MNSIKKYLLQLPLTLGLLLILFLALPQAAFAGFGISPAEITRDFLKPGARFEQELVLSRSDINEDLIVTIEPELEEMADWFQFSTGTQQVHFPQGQQRLNLIVIVNVPNEAEYKKYEGKIRFKASPSRQGDGGVSIIQGARVEVGLVTTELDVTDLEVKQIKAADVFSGENIRISLMITNKGNVPAAPSRVELVIQNLQQEDLETLEDTSIENIEPNETKEVFAEFSSNLPSGEYFGNVSVYLSEELVRQERLVFTINESVRTKDVVSIDEKSSWAFVGSIRDFLITHKQPLTYLAICCGILSLLILIWLLIKGSLSKKVKGAVFLLSTLVIGSLSFLFASALYLNPDANSNEIVKDALPPTAEPTEELSQAPETNETATEEAEVLGTFALSKDKSEPVKVSDPEEESGYRVYENPDINSRVIMMAKQGDTFNVLEEKELWFKVVIDGNNGSGWIHKKDIVDVQP